MAKGKTIPKVEEIEKIQEEDSVNVKNSENESGDSNNCENIFEDSALETDEHLLIDPKLLKEVNKSQISIYGTFWSVFNTILFHKSSLSL